MTAQKETPTTVVDGGMKMIEQPAKQLTKTDKITVASTQRRSWRDVLNIHPAADLFPR